MGDDITVVLLPDLPAADEVMDLAREWTAAGVLRPGCWVRLRDVAGLDTEIPSVSASLLGRDGEDVADLFTVLSRGRRRLARLVAAHLIPTVKDADRGFADQARLLGGWIQRMLPLDRGAGDVSPTQYRRISLIVPASGVSGIDAGVVIDGWDATVVAAPEDRVSPRHPADFVRPERNFAGHALLHVAAAGGLVSGVAQGTLDEPLADSSASYGRTVMVSRVWARSVLGQRTTDDLADLAMAEVMARNGIPLGLNDVFVASVRPDDLVGGADRSLQGFDGGLLQYRRPSEYVDPRKGQSGIGQAFRELVRFCGAALAMYVRWITGGLLRSAERSLTEMTYGGRGVAEVKLRPEVGSTLARIAEERLSKSREDARRSIGRQSTGSSVPAMPQLWEAVRGVSLGLLDGDQPSPFEAPVQGSKREIILDRGWVVPEPGDTFTVSASCAAAVGLAKEHRTLRSCDARAAAAIGTRLDRGRRHLEGLTKQGAARTPRPQASSTSTPLGAFHPAGEGFDEWAEAVTETEDGTVDAVQQARTNLKTWTSRRERSLMWRLASGTGEAWDKALSDFRRFLREIDAKDGFDPRVVDKARVRFLRLTTIVLLCVAGLVAFVWLGRGDRVESWPVLHSWRMTSGIVVLGLLVQSQALRSYYKAHSAFERQLNVRLHRIQHAVGAASTAIQERDRLSSLYDQVLDWADILARVAHGPWDLHRPPAEVVEPYVDAERLPFALQVARPDTTNSKPRLPELSAAVSVVVRPGWLRSAYRQLVDLALDEIAADLPARLDMVDKDLPHSTNRTRQMLLDALVDAQPQRQLADKVRDLVAHEAVPGSADLGADEVRAVSTGEPSEREPVSTYLEALLEPPAAFAHHIWSSEALVDKQPARGTCISWMPGTLADGELPAITLREVVGRGDGVLSAALRCDFSQSVDLTALTLFSPDEERPVEGRDDGERWASREGTWI